jgi:hypothetical protein
MSARIWHDRRRHRRIDRFALAVIDRETAETAEETRDAERRIRRTTHLLNLARPRQRSRD